MAHRELEHIVSLSPTEIASIESIIESSSLAEVHIEQNGDRIVIGGAAPAKASGRTDSITVSAPMVGTISLAAIAVGNRVATGDRLASLRTLDVETPVTAPMPGHIAAILIDDGDLAAYGADLFLIEPEETP